jgi:hypothetical protein
MQQGKRQISIRVSNYMKMGEKITKTESQEEIHKHRRKRTEIAAEGYHGLRSQPEF